jgi:hypothetical protein
MRGDMKMKKSLVLGVVLMVVIMLAVVGCGGSNESSGNSNVSGNEVVDDVEAPVEPEPVIEVVDNATMGEKNALKSAKNYLSFSGFSKTGLITQLEFEGYSNDEAVYAVENVVVDWNEQAVRSAENYLDFSSFSRDGLITQLKFEGYTQEQAEFAVGEVGY